VVGGANPDSKFRGAIAVLFSSQAS